MRVLVVGSGGREHALTRKLFQSERVDKLFVAPGNPGTAELAENVALKSEDIEGLVDFAVEKRIDLTFVGPEAPLVGGIVNRFQEEGLQIFGPSREAAQLEGSKVFAKKLMKKYGIPTGDFAVFSDPEKACDYIREAGGQMVVKADGLAAGKGVTVARNSAEALRAVEEIMVDKKFGQAGDRVVIEEFLPGEEATVLALTDGRTVLPLIPSQDHKPAYNNGRGPNTGGMGAYAPAPVVTDSLLAEICQQILQPTVEGLAREGIVYRGIIYCGLMINNDQARVLEYNVRFGDPEAQVVLPLWENDPVEVAEAVIEGRLEQIELRWRDGKAVCVVMASGGYPVEYTTGKKISGLNEFKNKEDVIVFQAGTERRNNGLYTAGGRVLGVTALGDVYKDTIDKAYAAVNRIDFEGAHYRTDIGNKAIN